MDRRLVWYDILFGSFWGDGPILAEAGSRTRWVGTDGADNGTIWTDEKVSILLEWWVLTSISYYTALESYCYLYLSCILLYLAIS